MPVVDRAGALGRAVDAFGRAWAALNVSPRVWEPLRDAFRSARNGWFVAAMGSMGRVPSSPVAPAGVVIRPRVEMGALGLSLASPSTGDLAIANVGSEAFGATYARLDGDGELVSGAVVPSPAQTITLLARVSEDIILRYSTPDGMAAMVLDAWSMVVRHNMRLLSLLSVSVPGSSVSVSAGLTGPWLPQGDGPAVDEVVSLAFGIPVLSSSLGLADGRSLDYLDLATGDTLAASVAQATMLSSPDYGVDVFGYPRPSFWGLSLMRSPDAAYWDGIPAPDSTCISTVQPSMVSAPPLVPDDADAGVGSSASSGRARVEVPNVAGLRVSVDDQDVTWKQPPPFAGSGETHVLNVFAPPGNHTVTVSVPGGGSASRSVVFGVSGPGSKPPVPILPTRAPSPVGWVEILVRPSSSEVLLNGRALTGGVAADGERTRYRVEMRPGVYPLVVSSPGHSTVQSTVRVEATMQTNVPIELTRAGELAPVRESSPAPVSWGRVAMVAAVATLVVAAVGMAVTRSRPDGR